MTFQAREVLNYRGAERLIRCLPLQPYLEQTGLSIPSTGWVSSGCWRGYRGTWELREDALYLTHLAGPGGSDCPAIELSALFPGCGPTVEATWFSGLVPYAYEGHGDEGLPFALVIYRGKLLKEKWGESGKLQVRLTSHVDPLFPDLEPQFLRRINAPRADLTVREVYADWLEERGDPRGQLLRSEVEQIRAGKQRPPLPNDSRFDIPVQFVSPDDLTWFWRWLAEIPAMTPDDQKYQEFMDRFNKQKPAE